MDQKLFSAAGLGNLCEVEKCLSMGADVLARNSRYTVLHSAVSSDNGKIIKAILDKIEEKHGTVIPYIDAKDTEGDTPLMWTAENGFVNAARILLERGADIEAKNSRGMTALHRAAKNNHKEVIQLLINRGASINVKDNDGLKPSNHAKKERHGELAGYLAFNAAEMYRIQGKYKKAWLSYKEALDIQEVVLGHDHPDVLMTRHNMAVALANQGKHDEALNMYQNVLDIQKRRGDLGPDHPGTLITRYNMALALSRQGDISEVFRIFREILNIKEAETGSDHPIPLKSADVKIQKKVGVKSNLTEKGASEGNVCYSSKDHQEQESDEECLEHKCDKLETIKKNIREHLEDRYADVFISRGEDRGRPAWHYFLVDQGKQEKFLEQMKKGSVYVADYGKILLSGFGEYPPQNVRDKIRDFFNKDIPNYFFVVKEECENVNLYHYVLMYPESKQMFLERYNPSRARYLYSGLGQDPPETISDKIIEEYFCINDRNTDPKLSVNGTYKNCWTSLHDAAYVGNLQVVKNHGANLFVTDTVCGRMPLHIAAREGHADVTELFLNRGINVNEGDAKNWTPLHYAAWSGHLRTVKLLMDKGADIYAKEATRGKKPIHVAAERGNKDIVDLLLKRGLSVDDTDKEGRTPLYYAAWKGHSEVVKNLADRGANIRAENIRGTKPIHVAALSGCNKVIQFLIDRGVNVNDSTKMNFTPLHLAAFQGYSRVAEFLIKKGANIGARNKCGKTPSDCAKEKGNNEIVDLLNNVKCDRKNYICTF